MADNHRAIGPEYGDDYPVKSPKFRCRMTVGNRWNSTLWAPVLVQEAARVRRGIGLGYTLSRIAFILKAQTPRSRPKIRLPTLV